MPQRVQIKKKDKTLPEEIVFRLLDEFIADSYKGRRTKKNGARIGYGTIRNYTFLRKALHRYAEESKAEIKIWVFERLTQKERERASRYYKKFYSGFTHFMYSKLAYYDNYVGLIIKCLRTFFNYLELERNIPIGSFHKSFYVPVEEIPIIALSPEQIRYMMFDIEFNRRIEEHKLTKIKDIFIFGCTVALRVSDLLSLTQKKLASLNLLA